MAIEQAYGHDVQDFLTKRFAQMQRLRERRLSQLVTAKDAQRYSDAVRRRFRRCFPLLPTHKTSLEPRVTGVVKLPGLRIETVMFQSRPRFWVTANLYLPRTTGGPRPAVMISSGHDPDAKLTPGHQRIARGLADMGYVVLAYDPLGQGERYQYRLPDGTPRDTVCEHIMAGNQMWLVGDSLGSWRAWDGIRAIDYLLTRPEVDPRRIGMHGCSGGGTLTSFVSMLDDRLAMIAPSCFGMPYDVAQEMEMVADSEQNPWGVAARGLNFADLFIARAPRPTLLMLQQHDFFSTPDNLRLFEEVRRVYRLLGAAENIQVHVGTRKHGVWDEDMEPMYRFFNRVCAVNARARRSSGRPLPPRRLWVTPGGQIEHGHDAWRVRDFTAQRATDLAARRGRIPPQQLPSRIATALRLPHRHSPPRWVQLKARGGTTAKPFRAAWRYVLYPEPGIRTMLRFWSMRDVVKSPHFYEAPPVDEEAALYLPHISSVQDVEARLIRGTPNLYTLDVRGIGEMRSLAAYAAEDFFLYYDSDFFHASAHFMLGESYLGKRVHDALAALDLLQSLGMASIHLQGRGLGSIVAAIAGVLHPAVKRVTLINSPPSFTALAQAFIQQWPASVLPFNVLAHFDLPDCYALLAKKQLRRVRPWDESMSPP